MNTSWIKSVDRDDIVFTNPNQSDPITKVRVQGKGEIRLSGLKTLEISTLITQALYEREKEKVDDSVRYIFGEIWIHDKHLRPTLDKIYQVIESIFPGFKQIEETIEVAVESFGKTYLGHHLTFHKEYWQGVPGSDYKMIPRSSSLVTPEQLSQMKQDLAIRPVRPLIEYEEGDWQFRYRKFPKDKWSGRFLLAQEIWEPVFHEQDKNSDDPHHGFVSKNKFSIERVMGFSCNDPTSPLSGIYLIKQRSDYNYVAMTLFAQKGKEEEFEAWLKEVGVLPLGAPISPADEFAEFYDPPAQFNQRRGIFSTLLAEHVERLRLALTECHYTIDPAYSSTFNNICHSHTGAAPFTLLN